MKDSDDDKSYESGCDEKVFHFIDRSDDLYAIRKLSKQLREEHGEETDIRKEDGEYRLFAYPVFGHGANARFRR